MFNQKKRILNRASKFIEQKNYGKARAILWEIADDPTARDWLSKIDAIEAQQRAEKLAHQNKLTRKLILSCGGIAAFICVCCTGFWGLAAIIPDPPPDPVIVEVDARRAVPVFGTPGTGTPIATLVQGDRIEIKDKEGEWTEIEIRGSDIRGYVQSTLIVTLTNTPRPTRTPGPTSRPRSTSIPVQNTSGQVYIAGNQGSVNVRSGPSTTNNILGSLTTGTRVTVTGESGGWYRIEYSGGNGWVSKTLTSTTKPQPQASSGNSGGNSGNSSGGSGCPGFNYTCSALTCSQAQACLAAGNGRLDRDNDGTACDSQCQ